MIGLLLFTAFLIFANGFFVAAEFALVKVRSTQLEMERDGGDRLAGVARSLVEHLDAYLSATQLGITLTSLGLGWIGEPAVARILEPLFHLLNLSEAVGHKVSLVTGFLLISFLHIVVGEVAPKSLAIARPVGTSRVVALPMRIFYLAFYPALVVLNFSSNALLRLVGVEPAGIHSLAVPGEELVRIAEESAAGGQITAAEGEMVSNVFSFSLRQAHEIMVPRNRVHGIDLDEPLGEQLSVAMAHGHSRYPVYDGDLDEVIGVLHLKDLLHHRLEDLSAADLRDMARPTLFVPETLPAEKLMRSMQSRHTHLAVVIDEYGTVAGVVTLEDALEELVGDIQDEYDHEEEHVLAIEGGFALEGSLTLDELVAILEVCRPQASSTTLQGWLMELLGRLPKAGDEAVVEGWRLRVVEVAGRVVRRVEAHRELPVDQGGS